MVLLGILKNSALLSVFPSLFRCFSASFPFQNTALLCIKPCVRLQGHAICKPHNWFFVCHPVVRNLPRKIKKTVSWLRGARRALFDGEDNRRLCNMMVAVGGIFT